MAGYGRSVASPTADPRIVLGIDYGTTFTGLSWMQVKEDEVPIFEGVELFEDWPRTSAAKVPSAISYSKTKKKCKQWGYDIDDESEALKWTKLELGSRTTVNELEILRELTKGLDLVKNLPTKDEESQHEIPRHLSKDTEAVIGDYLSKIARRWYQKITTQGLYITNKVPIDIVITHPAGWPYEAMNTTYRAVRSAFNEHLFPTIRDIYFTSEPEACALYTVQDLIKKEHNTLIPGDCFVLCDAGGGTVDVVAYYIDSIEPLKLTRVGTLSGERIGATFIDQAFLEWLQPKITNLGALPKTFGTGGRVVVDSKQRLLLERLERVKRAFSGSEAADIQLPNSAIVAKGHEDYIRGGTRVVVDGQEDHIRGGTLIVTSQNTKEMFRKSVTGSVNIISQQVIQVENTKHKGYNCRVTNVFLAGGFAQSDYLVSEIKKFTDEHGDLNLQVADNVWSSVVQGAVLKGMGVGCDMPAKLMRCPRYYGVCVSDTYKDWKNDGDQTVKDRFSGQQMVKGQIFWLIRQGDVILPEKPIEATFDGRFKFSRQQYQMEKNVSITFVATSMESPPSNLSELPKDGNEIYEMRVPLKLIPWSAVERHQRHGTLGSYFTVDVKFEIEVSQTGVEAKVKYYGSPPAKRDHDLTLAPYSTYL